MNSVGNCAQQLQKSHHAHGQCLMPSGIRILVGIPMQGTVGECRLRPLLSVFSVGGISGIIHIHTLLKHPWGMCRDNPRGAASGHQEMHIAKWGSGKMAQTWLLSRELKRSHCPSCLLLTSCFYLGLDLKVSSFEKKGTWIPSLSFLGFKKRES